jgi:hypothetical protein
MKQYLNFVPLEPLENQNLENHDAAFLRPDTDVWWVASKQNKISAPLNCMWAA